MTTCATIPQTWSLVSVALPLSLPLVPGPPTGLIGGLSKIHIEASSCTNWFHE